MKPQFESVDDDNQSMLGSMFDTNNETSLATTSACITPIHANASTTTSCGTINNNNQNENDDSLLLTVEVCGITFVLLPPPDIGALFAHQVWSGSKLLAEYLYQTSSDRHNESNDVVNLIRNKTTVELGAGTGLPSLMALHLQSKVSILTDYPHEEMLQSLREAVHRNRNLFEAVVPQNEEEQEQEHDGDMNNSNGILRPRYSPKQEQQQDRAAVVGHVWGSSTQPVLQALESLLSLSSKSNSSSSSSALECKDRKDSTRSLQNAPASGDNTTCCESSPTFDVALVSECIWNHPLHSLLAQSLDQLVHRHHGIALVTYAHHIPGLEEQDDAFFRLCEEQYGFRTETILTKAMPYMWDESKSIDIHLKRLSRSTVKYYLLLKSIGCVFSQLRSIA